MYPAPPVTRIMRYSPLDPNVAGEYTQAPRRSLTPAFSLTRPRAGSIAAPPRGEPRGAPNAGPARTDARRRGVRREDLPGRPRVPRPGVGEAGPRRRRDPVALRAGHPDRLAPRRRPGAPFPVGSAHGEARALPPRGDPRRRRRRPARVTAARGPRRRRAHGE